MASHSRSRQPRRRRWLWRTLVGVLVLSLSAAVVPVVWPQGEPSDASALIVPSLTAVDSARRYAVYVVDYGYHTAILIEQPTSAWEDGTMSPPGAATMFVEYAWGDRRFFMESRYAPWSLFASLLLPTQSVAYVAHHDSPPTPERGWRAVVRRDVSYHEWRQLVVAVEQWIVRDAAGHRGPAFPPVPGYSGQFYAAHGWYSWWHNCNRWTVARLSSAGLATASRVVLAPQQVWHRLRGFTAR